MNIPVLIPTIATCTTSFALGLLFRNWVVSRRRESLVLVLFMGILVLVNMANVMRAAGPPPETGSVIAGEAK